MSEFDLIPASYRQALAVTTLRRIWVAVLLLALLFGGGFMAVFAALNRQSAQTLVEVTAQTTAQAALAAKYQTLRAANRVLRKNSSALAALQTQGMTTALLTVVEQASADHHVWLQQWEYQRAAVEQGADDQVALQGEAPDHGALSGFVETLLASPVVADVRIATANEGTRERRRVQFRLHLMLSGA